MYRLAESRAIAKYLAAHYGPGLLKFGSKAESAAVEVWLEVESQEFNPSASVIVSEGLLKPLLYRGSPDLAVVKAQEAKLSQVLDVYEKRLSESKYLAGAEFTLADLNHYPYIYSLLKTPQERLTTSRPHVKS
ncbi:Glutathione S-transferase F7 [Apostasia shenzhenica]|uniref:glutathione transferase n=1 Tax=Apostasia shenzhenica TaxID=1088818 RepID=A0A2I0ADX5_9ASPA|nr:Glutathione S-transferase F7 [Apostasia shenzhenica]